MVGRRISSADADRNTTGIAPRVCGARPAPFVSSEFAASFRRVALAAIARCVAFANAFAYVFVPVSVAHVDAEDAAAIAAARAPGTNAGRIAARCVAAVRAFARLDAAA
ncbi:hypothetical protein MTR01_28435, partial [Burkholderia thailandensis]|uniref:hypothetical protein n=1 Tax=Burkholderia thailandensis TaxID=57975 RepID=UPI0022ABCA87